MIASNFNDCLYSSLILGSDPFVLFLTALTSPAVSNDVCTDDVVLTHDEMIVDPADEPEESIRATPIPDLIPVDTAVASTSNGSSE